jgi:hypothetical protein
MQVGRTPPSSSPLPTTGVGAPAAPATTGKTTGVAPSPPAAGLVPADAPPAGEPGAARGVEPPAVRLDAAGASGAAAFSEQLGQLGPPMLGPDSSDLVAKFLKLTVQDGTTEKKFADDSSTAHMELNKLALEVARAAERNAGAAANSGQNQAYINYTRELARMYSERSKTEIGNLQTKQTKDFSKTTEQQNEHKDEKRANEQKKDGKQKLAAAMAGQAPAEGQEATGFSAAQAVPLEPAVLLPAALALDIAAPGKGGGSLVQRVEAHREAVAEKVAAFSARAAETSAVHRARSL